MGARARVWEHSDRVRLPDADQRLRDAAEKARVAQANRGDSRNPPRHFWANDGGGLHALRVFACIKSLGGIPRTRNDSDGAGQVDVGSPTMLGRLGRKLPVPTPR